MPTRLTLAAAALLALAATPAEAAFGPTCPSNSCLLDPADSPDGNFDFDYAIPPDGRTYRWAIDFTAADPQRPIGNATITLAPPNQREIIALTRTATGLDASLIENPPFTFLSHITPGRSTWRVRAPAAFDFCATPGPVGEVCANEVRIWGNGTFLTVDSAGPVLAVFSESLVPEPQVWGLLVLGFGVVGGKLRTNRKTRPNPKLKRRPLGPSAPPAGAADVPSPARGRGRLTPLGVSGVRVGWFLGEGRPALKTPLPHRGRGRGPRPLGRREGEGAEGTGANSVYASIRGMDDKRDY